MKPLSLFTLIISVLTLFPIVVIGQLAPTTNVTQTQVDSIAALCKHYPNGTQLSIAFIQSNKVHYYGIVKEKDSLQFIDNQASIFEIGSISKVFTSSLLAYLVTEKKIKLNQDIQKYLGFKLHNKPIITCQQLASHTSGMPRLPSNIMQFIQQNPQNPYKNYTEDKLIHYLQKELSLDSKVGSQYAYSNLGAGLLGMLVAKVDKKTLEQSYQDRIFKSLKMTSSSTLRDQLDASKLVQGRDAAGNLVSNWDFGSMQGAGAILSTVQDLSKFALAQLDTTNQAFNLQKKAVWEVSPQMSVALGWHIIKTPSGATCYWHNGGTGGYSSSMAINVEKQTGIVILSNVSAMNPSKKIDDLCFILLKSL